MMGSSRSENNLTQRVHLQCTDFFVVVMSLDCSVGLMLVCLVLLRYARLDASACIQASRR